MVRKYLCRHYQSDGKFVASTVPSLEKFPDIEGGKIPGELILSNGDILLNAGREAVKINVTNDGGRPIQVRTNLSWKIW
ncbi:putative urease, beta subunit [Helianthus annuus]|nr:putative urease, beta subunit [Helianthus annuus]